jgi:predicted DNA-binding mobile mystery protein A
MPLAFVANKLNISEQSVNQLENNEAFETISLKSLRKLAEAIDCELHYAIIPRERSLEKIINKRAEFKARSIIKEVNKTMELEDQKIENSENSVKLLTKDFAENLNKNLWRDDEN